MIKLLFSIVLALGFTTAHAEESALTPEQIEIIKTQMTDAEVVAHVIQEIERNGSVVVARIWGEGWQLKLQKPISATIIDGHPTYIWKGWAANDQKQLAIEMEGLAALTTTGHVGLSLAPVEK